MIFFDFILVVAGAILSAIATIILIRIFKPKICFSLPYLVEYDKIKFLKIPVINLSKRFSVTNLKIEAAVVLTDNTYHFDLDRQDFIMLSKNNSTNKESPYLRVFQAYDVSIITKKMFPKFESFDSLINLLNEKKAYLRVRIHANHEFTGFGKTFEAQFNYRNESFTAKSKKNICAFDYS